MLENEESNRRDGREDKVEQSTGEAIDAYNSRLYYEVTNSS